MARPIGPDETSDTVERDLSELGATLLVEVLDSIRAGSAVAEAQDHATATYAPKITREDGLIDWNQSAIDIHNRVRGLYPWPHAFTFLDGSRVIVLRTHPEPAAASAVPGTIVDVTRDALHVAAGQGQQLAIHELQPEGKRAMSVRDYLAGRPIAVGARFAAA